MSPKKQVGKRTMKVGADPGMAPARDISDSIVKVNSSDAPANIVRVPRGPYYREDESGRRARVGDVAQDINLEGGELEIVTFPRTPGPPELSTSLLLYDGMVKELLALHPDFPADFSAPSPSRYEIVDIGLAGRGMVATMDLTPGDTIARERPLALMPAGVALKSLDHMRDIYEGLVASLHPENLRILLGLKNWKGADRAPFPLKGIFDTNSIGVAALPGDKKTFSYAGLARDISRVNHSCSPNAKVSFDLRTNSFSLRAVRPIRKGEEVYISYLHNTATVRKTRQEELLRRYGFVCKCKHCELTGRASFDSDSERAIIYIRCDDCALDQTLFVRWLADGCPTTRQTFIQEIALELNGFRMAEVAWKAMLREGYIPDRVWEPVLARLVMAHSVLEEEKKVRYYATRAAELAVAFTGSDRGWDAVAKNPTRTDFWGKRQEAIRSAKRLLAQDEASMNAWNIMM